MLKHWTDREKRHISEHYHAIGAKNLQQLLVGRSEKAIFNMAQRIGVKKSHDRLREIGRENVSKRKDRQCPFSEPPSVSS